MSVNGLLAVNFLSITCVMCLEPNLLRRRGHFNLIGPTVKDTINETDVFSSAFLNVLIANKISFL